MIVSIEFDCNLDFRTIEIEYVVTNAKLSTELKSCNSLSFQQIPKEGFSLCSIVTKFSPIFL